jgi:hypothetical protein
MISFKLETSGYDQAVARIADISYRLFDLRPLATRIAEIMVDQNRDARSGGLDQFGDRFTDLRESTMKRRIRQGRLGPPLAPDGATSDIITEFRAEPMVRHPDDITIVGHWPGIHWVGTHTKVGPHGRAVRDAVGMTPISRERAIDAFEAFIAELLAQTY